MPFRGRSSLGLRALVEFLEPRELLSAIRSSVIPLNPRQAAIANILTSSVKSTLPVALAAHKQDTSYAHITLAFAPLQKGAKQNSLSPPGGAYIPAQMRAAYGYTNITFGSAQGDGTGQTIAIVDAYDDPDALADLQTFDQQFGIPDPPSFEKVNQQGQTGNYPPTDPAGKANPNGTWEEEESLDIEWAHAIAPGANIILVETNSPSWADLIQGGVAWARSQPQVSVISMSWGGQESSLGSSELNFDSTFTTPAGHQGITFVASTGDGGAPGSYPAYSPNVVAVGGTTLNIVNNAYSSETGWSSSGGGISQFESQPSYQTGVVTQSTTKRTEPDVAMDANPNTGVAIVDSWDFGSSPWLTIGGTSLAAPMFAATVAIADQGRQLSGKGTLDGPSQTLPMLYANAATAYHDITSGGNGGGQFAGPGYDLVTGIGSPMANVLVPDLVGVISSISGTVFQDNNLNGVFDAADTPIAGVTVYLDANNNGVLDGPITQNQTSGTLSTVINIRSSATLTLSTSALATPITDVTVSLSIQHSRDSDLSAYLIAPDGTQITLFSGVGGTGSNFTTTTFDDSATTSISSGTAPFTGTYMPSNALATFDGHAASGTWRLKVTNSASFRNGTSATLTGWAITVTTAAEISTVSASDGTFSFPDIPSGNYTVREVTPGGYAAESTNGFGVSVLGAASVNFGNTSLTPPGTLTTTVANPLLYLGADPSDPSLLDISTNADGSSPIYRVSLATLPALTVNLYAPGSTLVLDYTNGSPVPAGGISVDGGGIAGNELSLNGGADTFSLDDFLLAASTDTSGVHFQNLSVISLSNAIVNYGGTFSTVDEVIVGPTTLFEF